MLASCANCRFSEGSRCSLGNAPDAGALLCDAYEMSHAFRQEVLELVRADLMAEINQAVLQVKLERAEHAAG